MNIFKSWREPVNALTHLIAFLFICPITMFLSYISYIKGGLQHLIPFFIFSLSICLLYISSTIYHMLPVKENIIKILKKIDHIMIFILIAGTYTPICLIKLNNSFGYTILTIIWIIALLGIILKIFWINAPRWFSTLIYVGMGWLSLSAFFPLIQSIQFNGILLLILGGIIYTIGAIIYATKSPKFSFKFFGFHEIFHLFVIGGSICHIIFMFKYVL
ncbi:PAQR family membrane homeostasis protein TrhA [[Clostridium] colinum]|uniref:PAQR family membrane homeostasis protein TrhA n=1 Tax=[Clostridium] colinum TaxID=36835 RepID=UPI0020255E89|nr:hemolysin III family protein [[Clostridium] colinum]